MQTVIEYIMLNYIWIIAGSIIILLAIIGYYADKTNFGQGKGKEEEIIDKTDIKSLEGKRMEDLFGTNAGSLGDNTVSNNIKNSVVASDDNSAAESLYIEETAKETKIDSMDNNLNAQNIDNEIDLLNKTEEKFEQFDKQFNELLPKKELVDDELLDEIDNLSLDKTQKINISDIPDLDDIDLPKIKSLSTENEDIWKF